MNDLVFEIIKKSGITDAGFCAFDEVSEKLLECRAKQRIPQNAKTVICCIFPYKVKNSTPKFISRYAAVPDYHSVCMDYLNRAVKELKNKFPQNNFEAFVDNSPIPEVYAAATAGLGLRGKNGLLITKNYGSYVFLGEIVTDLELECKNSFSECCACGRCKTACPKEEVCLSAVTQKKGELTIEESRLLFENKLLWGCDICAEVCPLNETAKITDIPEFLKGYRDCYTENENITGRAYAWRGEKCIRRNYENLKL